MGESEREKAQEQSQEVGRQIWGGRNPMGNRKVKKRGGRARRVGDHGRRDMGFTSLR